MPTPEEQSRAAIDRLLTDAGWSLQDKAAFNRNAAPGVAVLEKHTRNHLRLEGLTTQGSHAVNRNRVPAWRASSRESM